MNVADYRVAGCLKTAHHPETHSQPIYSSPDNPMAEHRGELAEVIDGGPAYWEATATSPDDGFVDATGYGPTEQDALHDLEETLGAQADADAGCPF